MSEIQSKKINIVVQEGTDSFKKSWKNKTLLNYVQLLRSVCSQSRMLNHKKKKNAFYDQEVVKRFMGNDQYGLQIPLILNLDQCVYVSRKCKTEFSNFSIRQVREDLSGKAGTQWQFSFYFGSSRLGFESCIGWSKLCFKW